jgi:hypothetical protein
MRAAFAPVASLLAAFASFAGISSSPAQAAPVPVDVNLVALHAIQTYALDEKEDDQVYLLVSGVAGGKDVNQRLPKEGTLPANVKKPPVTKKKPASLWKGELADGEFALLTVVLMQGKGADAAKLKAFADARAAAETKVAERSKKTLAEDDVKKLAEGTVKAQQAALKDVKKTFSRDKQTDHFGGLFNIFLWNNNGKLVKRLDPVGLTFGEHYGTDEKIYTKLKYTRPNVLVQDDGGEWSQVQLEPLSEDQKTIRVKMLENEFLKKPGGETVRNTTDYLAELQVLANGKPSLWELAGEQVGPGALHTYWDWAEDPLQ